MMKKVEQEVENSSERAWLEKEDMSSQDMIKTYDLGAWEIDVRNLKIKKIIWKGDSGSVYQGIYQNTKVAVKAYHVTHDIRTRRLAMDSFVREFNITKDLDHPNIIKFIGAKKNSTELHMKHKKNQYIDSTPDCCMVTEFLCGGTLYQYLQLRRHRMEKLPISMAIRLALDIAKGLSYLHSKKIMHRDVNTKCMLLDKNGRVKITTFGVSGIGHSSDQTPNIGTLGYMAPEVYFGDSYDHKCDVYSFGICLGEMYGFPIQCDLQAISDILYIYPNLYKKFPPEIPSDCPSALGDLMKQCWDMDPKKRPEMASVVQTLEELEASALHKGAKGSSCLDHLL